MGRFFLTLFLPFGRAPRWQFVFMLLIAIGFFIPIAGLAMRVAQLEPPEFLAALGNIMPGGLIGQGAAAIIGFYFLLIAFATRLHDRGRTGFWVILWVLLFAFPIGAFMLPNVPLESFPAFIPQETVVTLVPAIVDAVPYIAGAVGLLWAWMLMACLVFPGTHGRNWFGRDPSGDEVEPTAKAEAKSAPSKKSKAEAEAALAAAQKAKAEADAALALALKDSGNQV